MQLVRRFRLPALFCALAVLLCELISRPYAEMGLSDDIAYVASAHILALTGHIRYVGAAAAMLGSQLYIGAALIKLFGFSFTTVRMGTILVAMATACVLQRVMVRSGSTERNATIGTLALVISPLFLILSATFLSDIFGLFAIVLCLYCCLRALQSFTANGAIAWLFIAVVTNAFFSTARQVAWLGILLMVPTTAWLLRRERSVLIAGSIFTTLGSIFVFACMFWFHKQPYSLPAPLGHGQFPIAHTIGQLIHTYLDIPFLLLPIMAMFLPEVRKGSRRSIAIVFIISLAYLLLAIHGRNSHPDFLLEPTQGAQGGWVGIHGIHEGMNLKGTPPRFLPLTLQILMTLLSIGGLLGLIVSLVRSSRVSSPVAPSVAPSDPIPWKHLALLIAPFSLVYTVLLIPSATFLLYDRYALEPLAFLAICLVRYYQERIHLRLPLTGIVLIAIMAIYGVAATHNTFALYRARIRLAAEMRSAGTPDTSVDNGFEYNFAVELQHADHINDPGIVVPAYAFVPPQPLPPGTCDIFRGVYTPHIHPIYGVSFDPNACYGPAPFAPVHYTRWLASSPGTLYVVKYLPPNSPQYRR